MFSVAAFRSTLSHWPTEYDGENDESASGCRIFSKRGQIPDIEVDSINLIQPTKTELPIDPDTIKGDIEDLITREPHSDYFQRGFGPVLCRNAGLHYPPQK